MAVYLIASNQTNSVFAPFQKLSPGLHQSFLPALLLRRSLIQQLYKLQVARCRRSLQDESCKKSHAHLLMQLVELLSPVYKCNFSYATSCNLSHQPKSLIELHVKVGARVAATFIDIYRAVKILILKTSEK